MEPTLALPVPRRIERAGDIEIPTPLAERLLVLMSPGRRGYWFTTTGLRGFGLPELQTFRVPADVAVAWSWVLTGLGLRMLELWREAVRGPHAGFVLLPARVVLTADHVARAYGGRGPEERRAVLRLRFDPPRNPRADAFLTVRPPAGQPSGPYLIGVCDALFDRAPPGRATRLR